MPFFKNTLAAAALAVASITTAAPTGAEMTGIELAARSANLTARELDYGFLLMEGRNCATPNGKANVGIRNNDPGNSWIAGACYPLTGGLKISSGLSWASNDAYQVELWNDPLL